MLRDAVQLAHNQPFLLPWQVGEAESALGACLAAGGKGPEAAPLIRSGAEGLKTHPEAALRQRALRRAEDSQSSHPSQSHPL
jgi:hypothetical protein